MVRKFCLVVWHNDVIQEKNTFWSVISTSQIVDVSTDMSETDVRAECHFTYWGKRRRNCVVLLRNSMASSFVSLKHKAYFIHVIAIFMLLHSVTRR